RKETKDRRFLWSSAAAFERRSSSLIRAGKNGTAGVQDRVTGSYRNSKVLLSSPNSDRSDRSGRSVEELRFAVTRKDFLARADVALSKGTSLSPSVTTLSFSKKTERRSACSFEEKKNRHLGCLHPVGHFRHARRHVALLPPAVVLLATSPFLDDPREGRKVFSFKDPQKLGTVQLKSPVTKHDPKKSSRISATRR
ncbi:hypothetical protein V1478_014637, partial [Vespula squamosa]